MLRFSRLPRFSRTLVTIFFVAAFLSPLQFVAIAPGTPQGIFPEIVSLSKKSKAKSYPIDGQFYLLTIRITAPGGYVPGIEMIYRWVRTDQVVLPASVIYPPGVTSEEEEKQTGGPSGGMIFTLAIIEMLTKENLLQGRSIAGTGTIEKDGSIGAIGGIEEKILAAKRAGADLFLAPASNCSELSSIPEGITVASVATIDEAVAALNSKTPKGCDSLGA